MSKANRGNGTQGAGRRLAFITAAPIVLILLAGEIARRFATAVDSRCLFWAQLLLCLLWLLLFVPVRSRALGRRISQARRLAGLAESGGGQIADLDQAMAAWQRQAQHGQEREAALEQSLSLARRELRQAARQLQTQAGLAASWSAATAAVGERLRPQLLAEAAARLSETARRNGAELSRLRTAFRDIVRVGGLAQDNLTELQRIIKENREIASQTHILSIWANVEAETAGSQDQGFQVIAREITQLAAVSMDNSLSQREQAFSLAEQVDRACSLSREAASCLGAERDNGQAARLANELERQLKQVELSCARLGEWTAQAEDTRRGLEELARSLQAAADLALPEQINDSWS